jgi:hypothetical protein
MINSGRFEMRAILEQGSTVAFLSVYSMAALSIVTNWI